MPSKSSLLDTAISTLAHGPYICRSCRARQALSRYRPPTSQHRAVGTGRQSRSHRPLVQISRRASTISPATTVNAKPDVPHAVRRVYDALGALEHEAGTYINVSQLRLALRGLETGNPVTRIAVLGVEDQAGARRLARALLADPLAKEPPWEKQLTDTDDRDGRSLLLRYGERVNVDDRNPLVRTLFIPSFLLRTHNLEIFVQDISARNYNAEEGPNSFLVPSLETASSPRGSLSMVTYPVHKSLIYSNGFQDLLSLTKVVGGSGKAQRGSMVKTVVDGSWNSLEPGIGQSSVISAINLSLAEIAIETFRKSVQRSVEYEHAWFDSGLPTVSSWLSKGTTSDTESIQPCVRNLIEVVIDDTTAAIVSDANAKSEDVRSAMISTSTRDVLDQGITIWAENAHTELRDRISAAFASRSWKRIKWYKLFWRVDDVTAILSDILQRAWLVDAEKELIWMSGRFHQSGLLGAPKLRPPPTRDPEDDEEEAEQVPKLGRRPKQLRITDVVARDVPAFDTEDGATPLSLQAYPQTIAMARRQLTQITVPALQSFAQSLALQALSTTIFSTSISALLYISISATSIYEAGAIAALGTVYSMRKLQTRWEHARKEWKLTVREQGRRVLEVSEAQFREAVREGGHAKPDEAGIEERRVAREAVERVRRALRDVNQSPS